MSEKFPKFIHYEDLKSIMNEDEPQHLINDQHVASQHPKNQASDECDLDDNHSSALAQNKGLTGTRLRSYAFAVLTRKEYSKKDLIDKLVLYAQNKEEVLSLVDELARENYQSDARVAEMTVRSQLRKGKGPNRIKLALKSKHVDKALAEPEMKEIDWYEQAYLLKVKKYGYEVAQDAKLKAKQIRFLQYRGFEMDAIMKAIKRKENEE